MQNAQQEQFLWPNAAKVSLHQQIHGCVSVPSIYLKSSRPRLSCLERVQTPLMLKWGPVSDLEMLGSNIPGVLTVITSQAPILFPTSMC